MDNNRLQKLQESLKKAQKYINTPDMMKSPNMTGHMAKEVGIPLGAQESIEMAESGDLNGALNKMSTPQKQTAMFNEEYDDYGYGDNMPNLTENYIKKMSQSRNMGGGNVGQHIEGLPKEILEEMLGNPIDMTALEDESQHSVLDRMNLGQINEAKPKKMPLKQNQPNGNGGQIDYSIVKLIVEDAVKKYASALKKSIISELKGTVFIRLNGEKLQFLDGNDNLYEADLKFKRNVKKKLND